MRLIGRFLLLAIVIVVAFAALGTVVSLVLGTIELAFRIGVIVALVLGGMWAFRRVTGGRRRTMGGSGSRSLDMQFIRGEIDERTYRREVATKRRSARVR